MFKKLYKIEDYSPAAAILGSALAIMDDIDDKPIERRDDGGSCQTGRFRPASCSSGIPFQPRDRRAR
ncbi:unnamed protein product [Nippostrongylus brasiliensis]|uniref:Phytoene synthase n=1 Tax=Nippostrongylus brasiliensis TaxID=27835 RepID=A0A0N4XMY7_NIPBR|nr:unnamed protein product [Nippostrongylus brasiliensis]